MRVAVFADAHAHAEAFEAVIAAADDAGVDELWSLGDMIGGGPDFEHVVVRTRERCRVALMGNHDYVATGSVELERFSKLGAPALRSLEFARDTLSVAAVEWMRSRRPAARRAGVQCWHGGPRNPVWEFVGPGNAAACLEAQREPLGLVGHTHSPAAFEQMARRARNAPMNEPLDISQGKWLLNPGAVGAPLPPRRGWWDGLDADPAARWLLLDLETRVATWLSAPYDPRPARERARALGLDDHPSAT